MGTWLITHLLPPRHRFQKVAFLALDGNPRLAQSLCGIWKSLSVISSGGLVDNNLIQALASHSVQRCPNTHVLSDSR